MGTRAEGNRELSRRGWKLSGGERDPRHRFGPARSVSRSHRADARFGSGRQTLHFPAGRTLAGVGRPVRAVPAPAPSATRAHRSAFSPLRRCPPELSPGSLPPKPPQCSPLPSGRASPARAPNPSPEFNRQVGSLISPVHRASSPAPLDPAASGGLHPGWGTRRLQLRVKTACPLEKGFANQDAIKRIATCVARGVGWKRSGRMRSTPVAPNPKGKLRPGERKNNVALAQAYTPPALPGGWGYRGEEAAERRGLRPQPEFPRPRGCAWLRGSLLTCPVFGWGVATVPTSVRLGKPGVPKAQVTTCGGRKTLTDQGPAKRRCQSSRTFNQTFLERQLCFEERGKERRGSHIY